MQFETVFWTALGSPPLAVSWTISTTSWKSGKAMVLSLEWISVEFTLTSNDVLRPTVPITCASGMAALMALG